MARRKERPPLLRSSSPKSDARSGRPANRCSAYHTTGALLARTWTVDPAGVVVAITTRRAALCRAVLPRFRCRTLMC